MDSSAPRSVRGAGEDAAYLWPLLTTVRQDFERVGRWSWDAVRVTAPLSMLDVLTGEPVRAGEEFKFGPWDVKVLVESPVSAPSKN